MRKLAAILALLAFGIACASWADGHDAAQAAAAGLGTAAIIGSIVCAMWALWNLESEDD